MRAARSAQRYKARSRSRSEISRRSSDAGVPIAMGTDTGPAGRFQGYFEHIELEQMAGAGLSAAQVLRAATSDAARALERDDIGTLKAS